MKIGFIGIGNMGSAMIKGFLKAEFPKENIYVTSRTPDKLTQFKKETDVHIRFSNTELSKEVDFLFLAVKPPQYIEVLNEIQAGLEERQPALVSIAAGLSLKELQHMTKGISNLPILRAMPNLGSMVGEGMTAVCTNESVSAEQLDFVVGLLESIGRVTELPEAEFSVFSAIAGCSPAFTFLFIDSLAKAAVRHGIKKEEAVTIAAQAVLGSAKTVLETEISPRDLADQVASPGGTTIEGVLALEDTGFVSSVVQAVDAAVEKDIHLLKQKKEA